ncbi:GGDEF domain-containing protein [Rhodopseudomonas palustris]|uniref:diguanylate cyclase n=1 Tax=Rhodopseudomonas palustris TaxID=1076 RepID=A0A323UB59_RHOPL|nr:GGDEF domain-containing protein [Rhodopseudomonas palustris]PZA09417.1 GGDEF domain-containing protein [Rhodopseudomonas palustris]
MNELFPIDQQRRASDWPEAARQIRGAGARQRFLVGALLVNVAALAIDVAVLDPRHLAVAAGLRLLLVTPLVLLALTLNRRPADRPLQAVIQATAVVVFTLSVTAIGQFAPEPFAGRYMMSALFVVFAGALVSALSWRTTKIMTVTATVLYALIVVSGLRWPPAWANIDLVGLSLVTCVVGLRARRRKEAQIAELVAIRRSDARLKRDLRRANAALEQLSATDALTGVFNRRYLDDLIEQETASLVPSLGQSVLMIDVDHFKLFNDHGGHAAGDRCLQQIVTAIRRNLRSCDVVVRYGGEEFAVVLPGLDESELQETAERLCHAVSNLKIAHPGLGDGGVVTISVGIAPAVPAETLAHAIQRADQSLYRAKHSGRNRVSA